MVSTDELGAAFTAAARNKELLDIKREGRWCRFFFEDAAQEDFDDFYANVPVPVRDLLAAQKLVRSRMRLVT